MYKLTVSALTLLITAGCSDGPAGEVKIGTRVQGIEGGDIDATRTAVVGVVIESGRGSGLCTGSLIAPNLVMTAQHCVASTPGEYVECGRTPFSEPYGARSFAVVTETQLNFRAQAFAVSEVHVPQVGADLCGNDIALLVLAQPIPAEVATPMVPRIDRPVGNGERFTAVGYGETGNGSGAGTRRAVSDKRVLCGETECGRAAMNTEFIGNDGACQGDSGGPALDAAGYVLGALSRGGQGCSTPVYTGAYGWRDWLRQMGRRAADAGGYEPHTWVTDGSLGPPPPDTDGDGAADPYDNCPDRPNPDQADLDYDGHGDLCDDVDDRTRGGNCVVCDYCEQDADCGEGAICRATRSGAFCTFECQADGDCPDGTVCTRPRRGNPYCVNADVEEKGRCHAGFICGGPRPAPPDDGACHVCETCQTDEDCPGGLCTDLGDGRLACTHPCGAAECRGDSVCIPVNGRSLCVNPGHETALCPADYVCEPPPPEPEPEPEPEPDAPAEEPDPAGEGDDADAGIDPEAILERVKKKNDGCAAAPGLPGTGALPLMLLLLATRRRRT